MEFDEKQAIDFMRSRLPEAWRSRYDDDELLNIIDIIWDYYEENGMLDIDAALDDDASEPGVDDIVAHVAKMLRKDKGAIVMPEHVEAIVAAELAYEQSIGLGD
ncbi:MAG: hypothetical protein K2L49_04240 [Muribaculaceae bacterium]|nr:hypothetical protein [Muribaculaceae bacterium]